MRKRIYFKVKTRTADKEKSTQSVQNSAFQIWTILFLISCHTLKVHVTNADHFSGIFAVLQRDSA